VTLHGIPFRDIDLKTVSPFPFPKWHLDAPQITLDIHQSCFHMSERLLRMKIYNVSKTHEGDTNAVFVAPEIKISIGFKLQKYVSWHCCWLSIIIFVDSLSALYEFVCVAKYSRNLIFEIVSMYSMSSRGGVSMFTWVLIESCGCA